MNRGQRPKPCCRPLTGNGLERLSGRNLICRNTPSHIMSPTRNHPGPSAEVSLGVRGHIPIPQRAHAPPTLSRNPTKPTINALTTPAGTSNQGSHPASRILAMRRQVALHELLPAASPDVRRHRAWIHANSQATAVRQGVCRAVMIATGS
jgi:hypothetical protein